MSPASAAYSFRNTAHRVFEIGYWDRSSRAGRGYVSEAVNAIVRYAFGRPEARRVSIHSNASKAKSGAVAERRGFPLEGVHLNDDHVAAPEILDRDHAIYEALPGAYISA